MRTIELSKPQLAFLAVTRGLLGIGLGLLVASKLAGRTRRIAGFTLVAIGVTTTIPLAALVFRR
jgi:hypothetical protein